MQSSKSYPIIFIFLAFFSACGKNAITEPKPKESLPQIKNTDLNKIDRAFLDEISLKYKDTLISNDDKSKENFDRIIKLLKDIFNPVFIKKNMSLHFYTLYNENTYYAGASYLDPLNPSDFQITGYGGLLRLPSLNADNMILVLCHELGHALGSLLKENSMALEGEADYFSTLKCMRIISYVQMKYNPSLVQHWKKFATNTPCTEVYESAMDIAICARSILSARQHYSSSDMYDTPILNFDTPSTDIVESTLGFSEPLYPSNQCRYDTLVQGALCDRDFTELLNAYDFKVNSCTSLDKIGYRPRCWFKEPTGK